MRQMDLRQLAVLNAILQTNTLTEAASLLGVSQPAISKALKDIEERIEFKLFKRRNGRLHPTAEAQALYRTVQKIFSDINYLSRQTAELRKGAYGSVVIASQPAFAATLVAQAAGRVLREKPGIHIEIRELAARELVEHIRSQQVDFGVTHAPIDDMNVRSRILTEDEIMCILPADHRLAQWKAITPEQLAEETLIVYPRGSLVYALLETAFSQANVAFQPVATVNNALTAYAFAKTLNGIALADPYLFASQTFRGLTARPFRPSISIAPRVIHLRSVPPSRLSASFINELRIVAKESSEQMRAQLHLDQARSTIHENFEDESVAASL